MTELKNRGVHEILIATIDRLVSFPDTITAVLRQTDLQLGIMHMMRHPTSSTCRGKRSFPNDESIMKLIFLAMQNISKKWTMPLRSREAPPPISLPLDSRCGYLV